MLLKRCPIQDTNSEDSNINGLTNEIIVHSIPKKFQNKGRNILDYIKGQISWNNLYLCSP